MEARQDQVDVRFEVNMLARSVLGNQYNKNGGRLSMIGHAFSVPEILLFHSPTCTLIHRFIFLNGSSINQHTTP
ncbi:hypothetical protein YC2023_027765 [Brassica napus]